ncbi:hypothetical protein DPV74_17370 [Burkholderia sp. HAN2018]|nr:hypothetical protein [Burkholderia sp. HAN2018]
MLKLLAAPLRTICITARAEVLHAEPSPDNRAAQRGQRCVFQLLFLFLFLGSCPIGLLSPVQRVVDGRDDDPSGIKIEPKIRYAGFLDVDGPAWMFWVEQGRSELLTSIPACWLCPHVYKAHAWKDE